MKRLSLTVVLLLLVGAASWAQSTFGTGEWLHDCWLAYQRVNSTDTSDVFDNLMAGEYAGFVTAVRYVLTDMATYSNVAWAKVPYYVPGSQIYEIVGNYLDAHPEEWNGSAELSAIVAITRKYPAKQ